jgi:hypothetical protein
MMWYKCESWGDEDEGDTPITPYACHPDGFPKKHESDKGRQVYEQMVNLLLLRKNIKYLKQKYFLHLL